MGTSDESIEIPPLLVQIMQKQMADNAITINQLLDYYKEELARRDALIAAIRHSVEVLLSGPYMPNQIAIANALYPSRQMVEIIQARMSVSNE